MAETYPTEDQIRERLRGEYHNRAVSDDQRLRMDLLRARALTLAEDIIETCPNNRARSLALTNLQQAKMWAVQAIADEEE